MRRAAIACLAALALSGCATLTGNLGPAQLECREPDRLVVADDGTEYVLRGSELKLTLPGGSGRVLDSIEGQDSPCGLTLKGIQQGEDRSGGLFGLIAALFMGG